MTIPSSRDKPSRIPLANVVRALLFPVAATAITVILVRSHAARTAHPPARGGVAHIALVQKDSLFRPIPPTPGAPTGGVWYRLSGDRFAFTLRASGLVPHRRYELDLAVDGVTYTLASRPADGRGAIAIDTVLDQFAEGACVGANYHAPQAVRGRHRIKFAVKYDGSPPSGTMPATGSDGVRVGADLPCAGNGDGDYRYVLFESAIAEFEGRAPTSTRRTPPS